MLTACASPPNLSLPPQIIWVVFSVIFWVCGGTVYTKPYIYKVTDWCGALSLPARINMPPYLQWVWTARGALLGALILPLLRPGLQARPPAHFDGIHSHRHCHHPSDRQLHLLARGDFRLIVVVPRGGDRF